MNDGAVTGADAAGAGASTPAPAGRGVAGLLVLVAGATGASGVAVSRALLDAGARVVGVGSREESVAAFLAAVPGASALAHDLADPADVERMRGLLHAEHGPVDGLVHLVGGWRGGGGLAGQSDEDWAALERALVTSLRVTTRAFVDDLAASSVGRAVIVSSTSVGRPTAGGANYAAAKAAAESWQRSLADALRRAQPEGLRAAAVTLVIKALVDDRMRAASPEKAFDGFTDVAELAARVVGLWDAPAAELNGTRIRLAP